MRVSISPLTRAEIEANLWQIEAELEASHDMLRVVWLLEARRRYRHMLAQIG